MGEFDVMFSFNGVEYLATVNQEKNIYHVVPKDLHLQQSFGETMLLEANGDFAWKSYGPEHYQYVLAIVIALKRLLGFSN
ncbi:hypothetical protein KHS38_21790 [Mucilaginibacter sp. Bleaf8]|uniref:hypothetical protein n=1 Tax=Mucilaginibacter sp. Bleaf8 TaxID=2834430 RepID=UPI001BCC8CF0|nr:hypothetical protein [Mucilaginibacter sp. Bleaf8]MBS7567052.1 hypothetical protein [Mucilaginibacter sp. Bleaf8]